MPTEYLWFWLPFVGWFKVPELSAVAAAIIAALIGVFGLWFVKGRFRAERWWEKRAGAYDVMVEELAKVKAASKEIADYESIRGDPSFTPRWPPEQLWVFQQEVFQAHERIRAGIQRGEFLLSPRAIQALNKYVREVEEIGAEDHTTYVFTEWGYIAEKSHWEFSELAKVDLGTQWYVTYLAKKNRRKLGTWYLIRRAIRKNEQFSRREQRKKKALEKEFEKQRGRKLENVDYWIVKTFKEKHGRIPTEEEITQKKPKLPQATRGPDATQGGSGDE